MGDITSTRPASGAPIATAWGAEIHDAIEGIQSGQVSVPGITGSANGTAVVTFPRPYAVAPAVVISNESTQVVMAATAVSASGFTVVGRRWDGSGTAYTATVRWIAVGTPA